MTGRSPRTCGALLAYSLSALLLGCGATVSTPVSSTTNAVPPGTIKHVVVIFQENVSFDHYFGTYPTALNLPSESPFTALPGTPAVDGLSQTLLTNNPNASNIRNGAGATNPFRLSPADAATADQDHQYGPEQFAFDAGAMDLFPLSVGAKDEADMGSGILATTGLTMGYYDGNTVTAIWNYAQHYAISDRFFGTTFGPSTIGAINLISGQTNGAVNDFNAEGSMISDGHGGFTLFDNADPVNEICAASNSTALHMTGNNVGNLLNGAGVTWGWFAEGFDLTATNSNGTTGCHRSHTSAITKQTPLDYIPYIDPFQYYASTANPTHARPTSVQMIGLANDGSTNHQYDLQDFFNAVAAGNFPAVSFLKPATYHDGHAGFSDPLDEQAFLANTINIIEQIPEWSSTIIIVAYDDSDGWYDHVNNVINGSATEQDAYTSLGICGNSATALPGVNPATLHAQGRCGYGPRLPLLVISPWAKPNYVSHTITDQTSILRFIEDVFLNQQRIGQGSYDSIAGSITDMLDFSQTTPQNGQVLLLDETTGQITNAQ
ncbi:phospholipase C [Tunturiibacter lichenicola]|uniref:phospholipase C n=1 Tax=Tunturiibacter lichenicola TaxID=2051959 RepID=UPI003D9BCCDE